MTSRLTGLAAERGQHRIVLELENRIAMLCVHGGILFSVGIMMILTGSPLPSEEWFGPWARWFLGGWATLAGTTILVGAALGDDSRIGWRALVVGTITAALWHLGLMGTYAYAATTEKMALLAPGEVLSDTVTNRGYIPLIYLGYVLLVSIHSRTLLQLGPPPR